VYRNLGTFKGKDGTDAHRSFPRDICGFLKSNLYRWSY